MRRRGTQEENSSPAVPRPPPGQAELCSSPSLLLVVYNEGQEADRFFLWMGPQARSLALKYTRQIGKGGQRERRCTH